MTPLLDSPVPWLWFTLGPSTLDLVDQALLAGASGVRYTLSYATPDTHIQRARLVAARAAALGLNVHAIADLPGEKVRLGSFQGESVQVAAGDALWLTVSDEAGSSSRPLVLPLRDKTILAGAQAGCRIVVGDGGVELVVEEVTSEFLLCKVLRTGLIEQNRGLTLVGGREEPRSLMPADVAMLEEVLQADCFDAVAVSFVSDPKDLHWIRDRLAEVDRPIALIAKIETPSGVNRIAEICAEADVVMAARGDLALSIDPVSLYAATLRIALAASKAGVPWILATQLLEYFDYTGFPSRAELSDIVRWMEQGSSGAMLSRETVFGKRPLESIKLLRSLLLASPAWSSETSHAL